MDQKRTELCLGIIDPYNTINVEHFFELETTIGKSISAIFVHKKDYWNAELSKYFSVTKSLPTDKKLWKEDLDGIITGYFPTEAELVAYTKKTLELNLPIFQFSPVLRDQNIAKEIIDLAKVRNKLITCYNPYQYSRAFQEIHDRLKRKEVGKLRFINLKLYKNNGPDEEWFYKNRTLGGGVMSNLGIEFLELGLYSLNYPDIADIRYKYSSQGGFLKGGEERAEDFASIEILTVEGCLINFVVGWNLPIGQKSVVKAEFYGKNGGLCFQEIEGMEDIYMAEMYNKMSREIIASPPDSSYNGALIHWLWRVKKRGDFDKSMSRQILYRPVIFSLLNLSYTHKM